ncbi:Cupredoxin [Lentinula aciculospora]|uniref:Cupredoxin n=1 Tax=Lentinula aciculospora TaxID=153920 RepID=A0A9W9A200_9AGAR|nr:Cupredoxin [Lentinula aciculospora]
MYFTIATAALAVLPTVLATSWDVSVGPNGQLIYYPEYVLAEVGDTVNMIFHPKNHTVTQSSFDAPCVPLAGGVSSGFLPVASDSDPELPNFVITVNDTNPIWIHCEQKGHCGSGMVFAINPPDASSNHSFAAFQALAIELNGTQTSALSSISTPAPQSWATATATVSDDSSTWVSTYTSYSGTPEPTYAVGGPVTHNITVGINGQLAFGSANISAAIGDIVEFTFLAKNHSVVQSSFPEPCTPLANGFNLGFHAVDANTTGPTLSITINNTSPIWGYCAQTSPVSHCGSGMVFSINAVESGPNNFAAFLGLAEATLANSTKGDTSGATASSSSSSSSSTGSSNGALSFSAVPDMSGVSVVLAMVSAVVAVML